MDSENYENFDKLELNDIEEDLAGIFGDEDNDFVLQDIKSCQTKKPHEQMKHNIDSWSLKVNIANYPVYQRPPLAGKILSSISSTQLFGLPFLIEVQKDNETTSTDDCSYICTLCSRQITSKLLLSHIKSVPHIQNTMKILLPEEAKKYTKAQLPVDDIKKLMQIASTWVTANGAGRCAVTTTSQKKSALQTIKKLTVSDCLSICNLFKNVENKNTTESSSSANDKRSRSPPKVLNSGNKCHLTDARSRTDIQKKLGIVLHPNTDTKSSRNSGSNVLNSTDTLLAPSQEMIYKVIIFPQNEYPNINLPAFIITELQNTLLYIKNQWKIKTKLSGSGANGRYKAYNHQPVDFKDNVGPLRLGFHGVNIDTIDLSINEVTSRVATFIKNKSGETPKTPFPSKVLTLSRPVKMKVLSDTPKDPPPPSFVPSTSTRHSSVGNEDVESKQSMFLDEPDASAASRDFAWPLPSEVPDRGWIHPKDGTIWYNPKRFLVGVRLTGDYQTGFTAFFPDNLKAPLYWSCWEGFAPHPSALCSIGHKMAIIPSESQGSNTLAEEPFIPLINTELIHEDLVKMFDSMSPPLAIPNDKQHSFSLTEECWKSLPILHSWANHYDSVIEKWGETDLDDIPSKDIMWKESNGPISFIPLFMDEQDSPQDREWEYLFSHDKLATGEAACALHFAPAPSIEDKLLVEELDKRKQMARILKALVTAELSASMMQPHEEPWVFNRVIVKSLLPVLHKFTMSWLKIKQAIRRSFLEGVGNNFPVSNLMCSSYIGCLINPKACSSLVGRAAADGWERWTSDIPNPTPKTFNNSMRKIPVASRSKSRWKNFYKKRRSNKGRSTSK